MEIIGRCNRKFSISVKNVVIYSNIGIGIEICRKRKNVGGISNGNKEGRVFEKA